MFGCRSEDAECVRRDTGCADIWDMRGAAAAAAAGMPAGTGHGPRALRERVGGNLGGYGAQRERPESTPPPPPGGVSGGGGASPAGSAAGGLRTAP